jgi:hypothetical protein
MFDTKLFFAKTSKTNGSIFANMKEEMGSSFYFRGVSASNAILVVEKKGAHQGDCREETQIAYEIPCMYVVAFSRPVSSLHEHTCRYARIHIFLCIIG